MPPKLSSEPLTFFHKFILPGLFWLGWPVWIWTGFSEGGWGWIPAAGWTVACVFLGFWSRSLKLVSAGANGFVISNFLSTHTVPYSQLKSISEDSDNRTANIILIFDPPTPFGPNLRIVPPSEMFSTERFDEAACFLKAIIQEQASQA